MIKNSTSFCFLYIYTTVKFPSHISYYWHIFVTSAKIYFILTSRVILSVDVVLENKNLYLFIVIVAISLICLQYAPET